MTSGPSDSFDDLLGRLRQGDNAAAAEIYQRYAALLIGKARRRLPKRLQAKTDPESVVQSVFETVCRRVQEGQFDLRTWDNLWSLLVNITLRKCGHREDYWRANRRNAWNEIPIAGGDSSSVAAWEPIARDPLPEEAAQLTKVLEELLSKLEPADHATLMLRLQNCTIPEISRQTGRSEATVSRILSRVRRKLARIQQSVDSAS